MWNTYLLLKHCSKVFVLCYFELSTRYYSATILQMSGVRNDRLAIWLAGLTTLTNFLFTLLGVWLVERVGRRKLTLGSIIGKSKAKMWLHTWEKKTKPWRHSNPPLCFLFFFFSNRLVLQSESAGYRLPVVCPAQSFGHLPSNRPCSRQLHLRQIPVSFWHFCGNENMQAVFKMQFSTFFLNFFNFLQNALLAKLDCPHRPVSWAFINITVSTSSHRMVLRTQEVWGWGL